MNKEKDAEVLLEQDPGNPVFVEYAGSLKGKGEYGRAPEVCVRGLAVNPSSHRGRLQLAKIFYDMGCLNFAAREVEDLLKSLPQSKSLRQLLGKLKPDAALQEHAVSAEEEDETVAEADFDIDDLDLIEEDDS